MHRASIILVAIFITATLCSCGKARSSDGRDSGRVVHLSIDDTEVFADLIRHQQDYDSLFRHPFMAFLRELNREHGMRITLYTYERFGDGFTCIQDMPPKFKDDFRKASHWLRIGFHSRRPLFDSLVSVAEFRDSYNNVNSAIARFADSSMVASTLRFHYFFAPDSILNSLTGIGNLLCADHSDCLSYDLTAAEAGTVARGGRIIKNDVAYIRTHLRLDDNYHIFRDLNRLEDKDTLVVFAHEWKLWHSTGSDSLRSAPRKIMTRSTEHFNQLIFKKTIKWLDEAGYEFSFLE